ncbi:hypothetical protein TrVE_jg12340 [Triparma verrucosa]|uniref:Uncharacterized protein n=1 Tax=Triparma verrucosa TaxID=1606542 RepID=A0A9W7BEF5_9STRA|nr:hypothetical protein TrVE_jg12340 [Triparma verrucosa]
MYSVSALGLLAWHALPLPVLGAAQTQTSYLIIPGASGFKTDAYTGSIDLYQLGFLVPVYKENRGHVGTWLTKGPDAFYAMGAEKVLPKFIYNETLVETQEEFEAGSEERPDLYVPTDYAFYNSQTNKARRLEMVFDAIMNTEKPLLVLGTSEGGAIIQKLLESEELVAHMTNFSHSIAIISPAYAVGDESIVDDPFYSRAKLNPDCWYICSQATKKSSIEPNGVEGVHHAPRHRRLSLAISGISPGRSKFAYASPINTKKLSEMSKSSV